MSSDADAEAKKKRHAIRAALHAIAGGADNLAAGRYGSLTREQAVCVGDIRNAADELVRLFAPETDRVDARPEREESGGASEMVVGAGSVAPRRLLVVDDQDMSRRVIRRMLHGIAVDIREAPGGREAIALAHEWKPDAVLLDLEMPELDGVATLAELRSDPELAQIPAIAVTAHASTEDEARCFANGFAGYLSKPMARASMLVVLDEVLGGSAWRT
jgi:CheY-like chemotaxis protein